jgi:hypothetical protein
LSSPLGKLACCGARGWTRERSTWREDRCIVRQLRTGFSIGKSPPREPLPMDNDLAKQQRTHEHPAGKGHRSSEHPSIHTADWPLIYAFFFTFPFQNIKFQRTNWLPGVKKPFSECWIQLRRSGYVRNSLARDSLNILFLRRDSSSAGCLYMSQPSSEITENQSHHVSYAPKWHVIRPVNEIDTPCYKITRD